MSHDIRTAIADALQENWPYEAINDTDTCLGLADILLSIPAIAMVVGEGHAAAKVETAIINALAEQDCYPHAGVDMGRVANDVLDALRFGAEAYQPDTQEHTDR